MISSASWGRRVASSATGLAAGMEGAERAIAVLSEDLDGTTSLLGNVSLAVRHTAGVVQQTRETLDEIGSAGDGMIDFSLLMADDLTAISSSLGPLGGERLAGPAERLRLAAASGESTLVLSSGLRSRLGTLSETLGDVASSVDSLSADLEATGSAMEDARAGLVGFRHAVEYLSTSEIASTLIFLCGMLLFFLGLQEVLLCLILGRTAEAQPSPSPARREGRPSRGR
jgi:phage-related protein